MTTFNIRVRELKPTKFKRRGLVINGWSTPTKKTAESKETDRNASLQKYGKPGHWPHGKFTSFPVKRKSNCTQKSRIWSLRSQGRYVVFFFLSHCVFYLPLFLSVIHATWMFLYYYFNKAFLLSDVETVLLPVSVERSRDRPSPSERYTGS